MTSEEIRRKVEELGPWFHNLGLKGVKPRPGISSEIIPPQSRGLFPRAPGGPLRSLRLSLRGKRDIREARFSRHVLPGEKILRRPGELAANRACAEALLRTSGFEVMDNPEYEVFLCGRAGKDDIP